MSENEIDNKAKIEELNKELTAEMAEWDKLEVDPNMVIAFNPVGVDIYVHTLSKFLAEKDVIDEDEFVVMFKQRMLDALQNVREQVEPEVRKARLKASGLEFPNMGVPQEKIRKH